jgi:hypothetical protein
MIMVFIFYAMKVQIKFIFDKSNKAVHIFCGKCMENRCGKLVGLCLGFPAFSTINFPEKQMQVISHLFLLQLSLKYFMYDKLPQKMLVSPFSVFIFWIHRTSTKSE